MAGEVSDVPVGRVAVDIGGVEALVQCVAVAPVAVLDDLAYDIVGVFAHVDALLAASARFRCTGRCGRPKPVRFPLTVVQCVSAGKRLTGRTPALRFELHRTALPL